MAANCSNIFNWSNTRRKHYRVSYVFGSWPAIRWSTHMHRCVGTVSGTFTRLPVNGTFTTLLQLVVNINHAVQSSCYEQRFLVLLWMVTASRLIVILLSQWSSNTSKGHVLECSSGESWGRKQQKWTNGQRVIYTYRTKSHINSVTW